MVRITEDLIRKRAEHNNCEISTLEEVSLHQQDIERIENIDKWCRDLTILYLQSNLIPKIENVSRLKKLDYLNLALNNVERIENLEGCESLRKLDLTVNFIGELTSIKCLRNLYHFRELYLTGNPCSQFEGYRDYVIATLPNLKYLDGKEIEKSERILALQDLKSNERKIIEQQKEYLKEREEQKAEAKKTKNSDDKENGHPSDAESDMTTEEPQNPSPKTEKTHDELEKEFWEEVVPFTPEYRIEVHKHLEKLKAKDSENDSLGKEKKIRKLFADDGRPLNINEAKIDFRLTEDSDANAFILDLSCYRYLDTNLLEVDVQPLYVRVVIKGKIFQLCLSEEINTDTSHAKRSQVTGNLLITMPKMKPILYKKKKPLKTNEKENQLTQGTGNQKLEVGDGIKSVDYHNIVNEESEKQQKKKFVCQGKNMRFSEEIKNDEDFIDDPNVPPLM